MDKGIPGPGFLAHLLTSKYAEHQPLYRQQQMYRRTDIEIPRSTMCGWIVYAASLLAPIVEAMKASVHGSRRVHTDDTPIAYFRDVLMRIHTHAADRIEELIPREWKNHFAPRNRQPQEVSAS